MRPDDFARWFLENASRLKPLPGAAAADEMGIELAKIDKLHVDGIEIDAASLRFDPLESVALPGELGIRILAPPGAVAALAEVPPARGRDGHRGARRRFHPAPRGGGVAPGRRGAADRRPPRVRALARAAQT
jgi:hypothetical protein